MSNPEIITVNSEALEAQIRDLLPSQSGFGSELQASNVIMPIIDLTATAEGSGLSENLSQAMAFGSITSFEVANATSTVLSATGFYRFLFTAVTESDASTAREFELQITDGSTTKVIVGSQMPTASTGGYISETYDLTVFLTAGDSIIIRCDANTTAKGSFRQIATVTGTTVNPVGFVAE